ncbi:MAG: flagellar filament capping protein FliD [Vicinamibacterales bacterium]
MGSPITFSGFNQIDFTMILNAVMAQEREPITRLETQKKTLDTQKSAFGTLATKLTTLSSAIEALGEADSLAALAATSTSDSVGVATTSGTLSGTYDVVVSTLARAQVVSSTGTYAALDAEVATGGTFTLTDADGVDTVITLTGSTTLEQLAAAINAETDAPARAAVVRTGTDEYRLVLTAVDTGSDGAFTVTDGLSGGSLAVSTTRTAQDAAFTVNGVAVTSGTNEIDGAIPGVTMTLNEADPGATVVVDVSRDVDAAAALVDGFMSAYNDLRAFMRTQEADAVAGKASIGRDPLLRGLRDSIRLALQADYGGDLARLASAGIVSSRSGDMELDREMFDAVFAASPEALQTLLSGASGDGGVFGALEALVDDYAQAGGLVSDARDRLTDQMSSIGHRIDDLEARLAVRRAALQREYMAADMAMSQLNSQSASLSSLGGEFRLF